MAIKSNTKKVRTRFAPSPTGYMHVGNLRTALYAYLLAKKHGGNFILRIEDTDQQRLVEGAEDIIYNTLRKTGLLWDEGPDIGGPFGPYVQSKRMDMFLTYAKELVQKEGGYYCFCEKDRLTELREIQQASGIAPKYDGHCRHLTKQEVEQKLEEGAPYVIRQKIPQEGTTSLDDVVFGTITVDNNTLDDQVLIKADGMPTYNFANVVDDHLMGISHVIRGNEYLSSAPKYNLLYEAFGWDKPISVHCPPVMKNATEKLSKRNGDASFEDLIQKGYLTEAVINYIALLGWAPKGEHEIFTLKELIDEFEMSGISKSPAIFDDKKLKAINGVYIRALSLAEFKQKALPYIRSTCQTKEVDLDFLCTMLQPRTELFTEIPEQVDFIDALPDYALDLFCHKKMKTTLENSLEALEALLPALQGIESTEWNTTTIHQKAFELIEQLSVKNGIILWPLRTALSGKQFTPGGGIELAALIGKAVTVERIAHGIAKLKSNAV